VSATARMPSSAARRARSSGENAPSFSEKNDRTSRCTKEETIYITMVESVSMMSALVRTQIQLTEEQAVKLKRMAAERGVSMAEVIRDAVDRLPDRDDRDE